MIYMQYVPQKSVTLAISENIPKPFWTFSIAQVFQNLFRGFGIFSEIVKVTLFWEHTVQYGLQQAGTLHVDVRLLLGLKSLKVCRWTWFWVHTRPSCDLSKSSPKSQPMIDGTDAMEAICPIQRTPTMHAPRHTIVNISWNGRPSHHSANC